MSQTPVDEMGNENSSSKVLTTEFESQSNNPTSSGTTSTGENVQAVPIPRAPQDSSSSSSSQQQQEKLNETLTQNVVETKAESSKESSKTTTSTSITADTAMDIDVVTPVVTDTSTPATVTATTPSDDTNTTAAVSTTAPIATPNNGIVSTTSNTVTDSSSSPSATTTVTTTPASTNTHMDYDNTNITNSSSKISSQANTTTTLPSNTHKESTITTTTTPIHTPTTTATSGTINSTTTTTTTTTTSSTNKLKKHSKKRKQLSDNATSSTIPQSRRQSTTSIENASLKDDNSSIYSNSVTGTGTTPKSRKKKLKNKLLPTNSNNTKDESKPRKKKSKLKSTHPSNSLYPQLSSTPSSSSSNPHHYLSSHHPHHLHHQTSSKDAILSKHQQAVSDMYYRAKEEDLYSALGSIVDTSDDEDNEDKEDDDLGDLRNVYLLHSNCIPGVGGNIVSNSGGVSVGSGDANNNNDVSVSSSLVRLDRSVIVRAMKKRLKMEEMKGMDMVPFVVGNGGKRRGYATNTTPNSSYRSLTTTVSNSNRQTFITNSGSNLSMVDEYGVDTSGGGFGDDPTFSANNSQDDISMDGTGKRKKKRKKGKNRLGGRVGDTTDDSSLLTEDKDKNINGKYNDSASVGYSSGTGGGRDGVDQEDPEEEDSQMYGGVDDSSIFGQTAAASNATWVECDKCKKWRRLRGVVDAKKLPSKWYCSMNKKDPERAKCSAPEEEYNDMNTPESATDQRTRKHLRLWVRRLQCNEKYEDRLPTMTRGKRRNSTATAKDPYEWVRCCNPSCGKWRAVLKSMDANSIVEACKSGEWYCVLNTWDEKMASCAAPQENLPVIHCPPWVLQNEE